MFRRAAFAVPRAAATARVGALSARPVLMARAASTSANVKPPVQLYGLDGTYATALYVAAAKESSLEAVEKSIASLKELLDTDPETGVILGDPTLSPQDKKAAIDIVADKIKGDKIIKGFLETLSANARLGLLREVITQFDVLSNAHRGLVEATVTSVKALDSASLKRLEKAISGSKYVGEGKSLKLTNNVDPSIRGGLVVSIGDRTVDASLATKLQRYNQLLHESV